MDARHDWKALVRAHARRGRGGLRAPPGGLGQQGGVLDEVAEGVAAGPRPADQLADRVLAAEAGEALLVEGGEAVVVPADGAANPDLAAVEAASGMVGGRDTARRPLPQPGRHLDR